MKFVAIRKFHSINKSEFAYMMYGYIFDDSTIYWSMRFYKETWYPPLSLNLLS